MKQTFVFVLSVCFTMAAVVEGCYYDNAEDLYPTPEMPVDTIITFADDIQPMITKYCAISGCHATAVPGQPQLTSYQQIYDARDRIEARAIDMGPPPMPPAGHPEPSAQELADLKAWIDEGAPNN